MRTVYLLEWIGSREMRQEVTATTNKIESYNGFAKWFSFGGDVLAENDPEEQQKRLRYNDLIASAVIRARCGPDGLRDDLLRLHGIAHTLVNGASLSYSTAGPTLVEQVDAVLVELEEWIAALEQMRKALEPLEQLRPESE